MRSMSSVAKGHDVFEFTVRRAVHDKFFFMSKTTKENSLTRSKIILNKLKYLAEKDILWFFQTKRTLTRIKK